MITLRRLQMTSREGITLRPGEKRQLKFELGPKELGFCGLDMKYAVEPGKYEITMGTSSVGGMRTPLSVSN
jgi:beta-glucosidase